MSTFGPGRRIVVVLAVGLLSGLPILPSARAATTTVDVADNSFIAQRIAIQPGDTVHWTVSGNGHTITADDRSYEFPAGAANGAELHAGDEASMVFPERGVFYYHCRIHGGAGGYPRGMTGAIYVGISPDEAHGEVRQVPSDGYPTLRDAVRGIGPGSKISVAPGVYRETLLISSPDVVLEGAGAAPTDVVIEGDGMPGVPGVWVSAGNVTVRNLSVRGSGGPGIKGDFRAPNMVVDKVDIQGGSSGIETGGGTPVTITRFHVAGVQGSGVSILGCNPCSALVGPGRVEHSRWGVGVNNVSGVVVRDIELTDNDVGLDVESGTAIDVTDVVVRGGSRSLSVRSTTTPSLNVRILDNEVSGYSDVGLAWDLFGLGVCFSGNVDPTSPTGEPTSMPPLLQRLFPCK